MCSTPADARLPFYVLNGPYGIGFAAPSYARPTYSEGGYAFAGAYPYDLPYVRPRRVLRSARRGG